jgi:cytochrome c-type biogenesis protein CcmH/NrfG
MIVGMGNLFCYKPCFSLLICLSTAALPAFSPRWAAAETIEGNGAAAVSATAAPQQANDARKIEQEIEALRAAMKEKPDDSTAVRLGQLLMVKGEMDAALRSFEDALKLNPRSLDAKVGKGRSLAALGESGKAEQVLRDALVLNPDPARVHYELGLIYEGRGDFTRAVSEYKEGLKKYEERTN